MCCLGWTSLTHCLAKGKQRNYSVSIRRNINYAAVLGKKTGAIQITEQ